MSVMRALAQARGAQIHYGSPVVSVSASAASGVSGTGAVVHTADRSWPAPAVVVAAGAWLEPLLAGQVRLPPLVVTQQQAFHFAPRAWAGPRPVFIYRSEVAAIYGLLAGRDGEVPGAMKIGEHGHGRVTTGDDRDGIVSPASRETVRAFVRDTLEDLEPDPVGELTCLYTSTATEDFILDRQGPFVVCSPCSGHGAKFAPLAGEIAADLACGDPSPDPRFTLAAHRDSAAAMPYPMRDSRWRRPRLSGAITSGSEMRQFGELEAVIMDRLWEWGRPALVREMVEDLRRDRPLAYTTVMTVMENLHRKGWLRRERDGRAWRYEPTSSRSAYTAALMNDALGTSTDRRTALAHFVLQMSPHDVKLLRQALDQARGRAPNSQEEGGSR